MASRNRPHGFTLIELAVTIVILVILLTIAMPSFQGLAERSALRGASDGLEGVITTAKEESIKRDRSVWVAVKSAGDRFCAGASTTAGGCDCNTAPGSCDVAVWPTSQREQQKVTLQSVAFGDGDNFGFDPKTGLLTDPADMGGVALKTSKYAIQIQVTPLGRVYHCTPSGISGTSGISGLEGC